MPSKREGSIQPSVTSHPPRFTAFTLSEPEEEARSLAGLAQEERETRHDQISTADRYWERCFALILFVQYFIIFFFFVL
jgi:hypothetical protein